MERLTTMSEITDMPTIKALCESCGESGCDEPCEEYQDKGCVGCPIQVAFNKLYEYENTGITPDQVTKAYECLVDTAPIIRRLVNGDKEAIEAAKAWLNGYEGIKG